MAIDITKEPGRIDLAYGKNIVTLDGAASGDRYIVRVLDESSNTIADIRQLPNPAGVAHFDLQGILKSQVTHNPAMESITYFATGENEVFEYTIETGSIAEGTSTGTTQYVLNGRKSNTDLYWNYSDYIPTIGKFIVGGIENLYLFPPSVQLALTDRIYQTTKFSNITDGKPSWANLTSNPDIFEIDLYDGDDYTLSFLNDYNVTTNPLYNDTSSFTNGINGFLVALYSGSTLLTDSYIPNTTVFGGGPDTFTTDAIDPTGEYRLITPQTGTNQVLFNLYPNGTHYYMAAFYWTRNPATYTLKTTVSHVYRFNVVEKECNDFENIQVSWVNSFGVRDYFNFTKRNDYKNSIERKTYQQLDADWAGSTFSVNSYNRGERVYNTSITEEYTANTRYLSDDESTYLQNLYISPDVKVRFEGSTEWVPVVITDNSYTKKTNRTDKMFQHTINFRLSNPQQIQNG